MSINYHRKQFEDEQEGKTTLHLIGLENATPHSSIAVKQLYDLDYWPTRGALQGTDDTSNADRFDLVQLGVVPEEALAHLEANSKYRVHYDPEVLAEVLLEANYLPTSAFGGEDGTPPHEDLHELVIDTLGIDWAPTHEEYYRQLCEVANEDPEKYVDAVSSKADARASRLRKHSRFDLQVIAEKYGYGDESGDSVSTARKVDLAEYLASHEKARSAESALRDRADVAPEAGD